MTRADMRDTEAWKSVEDHFRRSMEPGFGSITGAMDLAMSPDGRTVAFTATYYEKLEGLAQMRVCTVDTAEGVVSQVTSGDSDRLPKWSPDGRRIAFLSDRAERGVEQLLLIDSGFGEATATPVVDGTVEYFHWSPSGRSILLAVAERGADRAGGQGSGTIGEGTPEGRPDWMPEVHDSNPDAGWRRLHLYDADSRTVNLVPCGDRNVWEATWLGDDAVVAIVSDGPGEELWYTAQLVRIDMTSGDVAPLLTSPVQLGVLAGSPGGDKVAVVEAVCSDRWIVAGDLQVTDVASVTTTPVDTAGVDVTWCGWRDDNTLTWLGIRGTVTVAGEWRADTGTTRVIWESATETCGVRYPEGALAPDDTLAVVLTSYQRYPEIARIGVGDAPVTLASLNHPGADYLRSVGGTTRPHRWVAPDGLEIEGLLTSPEGAGPFPLLVLAHGGPVWAYRPSWSMYYHYSRFFASRRWAVLHPNPRGSSGRGQKFAHLVFGDMGGDDTGDFVSGVESLVEAGIADKDRLVVMGGSYGGFVSGWLPTQTDLFAAAVPISEVSEWTSQHWTSNIPHFDSIFLASSPFDRAGNHVRRSPLMHADRVRTPMLHITGALDRCTPATQATAYHRALLESGATSECIVYPKEAHGVRSFLAIIDHLARIVTFLDTHLPSPA